METDTRRPGGPTAVIAEGPPRVASGPWVRSANATFKRSLTSGRHERLFGMESGRRFGDAYAWSSPISWPHWPAQASVPGWTAKGLREGEMPYSWFLRYSREDQPVLFWMAICTQIVTTLVALALAVIVGWWGLTH